MKEFKLVKNDEEFRGWAETLETNPWPPAYAGQPPEHRMPVMSYPALVAVVGGEFVKFTTSDAYYLMAALKDMQDNFELNADEVSMLNSRNKIGAIKSVRYRTNLGLKEAKDLVDMAEKKLR